MPSFKKTKKSEKIGQIFLTHSKSLCKRCKKAEAIAIKKKYQPSYKT